jgi:hypothetical protein
MGMSPDASVAWGFDLGSDEDGYRVRQDKYDELYGVLDEVCGFTEEPPWTLRGPSLSEEETRAQADAWRARRDAVVLVDTDFYGYDYGGNLLVLKRQAHVNWGVAEFDPKVTEPPTPAELECFGKVLDYLEYKGDRTPKLLIWASYG